MTEITREHLRAYLDDALSDAETARVEQAIRNSDGLRGQLTMVMHRYDSSCLTGLIRRVATPRA